MAIRFWNPYTKQLEIEDVYGDNAINFLYDTLPGKIISEPLAHPYFSKLCGLYQSSPLSKKAIEPFISKFKIDMSQYEKGPFKSFNDFFIRKFIPGARNFSVAPKTLSAFSEGRYLAYERVTENQKFPVKGKYLSAKDLLQDSEKAIPFKGGPIIIARLCPTDYHRFHFPDDGEVEDTWRVHGSLYSVNPVALGVRKDVFITNERQVTLLKTKNFGRLAYIEVGALCVGKIVQSYKGSKFTRGEEKGYFLFGGSTVIVLGEQNKLSLSGALLKRSAEGVETYLHLGDSL